MSLFNAIRKLFSKRARLEDALRDVDARISAINLKIRAGGNITSLAKQKTKLMDDKSKLLNELASL